MSDAPSVTERLLISEFFATRVDRVVADEAAHRALVGVEMALYRLLRRAPPDGRWTSDGWSPGMSKVGVCWYGRLLCGATKPATDKT